MAKTICVLGSTGSIGRQALDVAERLGRRVLVLAAHSNVELLERQARKFLPELVCVYQQSCYSDLRDRLKDLPIQVASGMQGLCQAAAWAGVDIVINAVVGMVGLQPTLSAIQSGKDVALANKETLVTGGALVTQAVKDYGVRLLPVDSEHSAIFQCLQGNISRQVHQLILTASGGPFYGYSKRQLASVTLQDALQHPTWSMGRKITVDSATMMNKGLELIEACWLFDVEPEKIEIVVHRESILHSAVEYRDGAVIGQMGQPDMRLPIQYALTFPDRLDCPAERLSLTDCAALHFSKPDEQTFLCLPAARSAMEKGGCYPALINGANEQAVELFLKGKLSFLEIGEAVCAALDLAACPQVSLQAVFDADRQAREMVLSRFA